MAGNSTSDLVSALRNKLSDDRPAVVAFSIAVTVNAKSAQLELTNNHLNTNIEQGEGVTAMRLNLADSRYSTVGKLFNEISKRPGYKIAADQSMHSDHPSSDLYVEGLPSILANRDQGSYSLKHHIWSDTELIAFLTEAINLHNPNYPNVTAVPKNEHPFVLMKAAATAYRQLAADTARRKGLDQDASVLLRLASDLENQYTQDLVRLRRVVPVPKADESKMGTGEVVQGTLVRASARAGYTSPMRAATNFQPPHLHDPEEGDVEDTIARLRWSVPRELRFTRFELWRDTQPFVERSISGRFTQIPGGAAFLAPSTQYSKAGTAKQVLGASGAFGGSPVFDGFYFATFAEISGQRMGLSTFIDGYVTNGWGINNDSNLASALGDPLEPETEYYYRLYSFDTNGGVLASEVKKIRTKSMRARFQRNNVNGSLVAASISPTYGPLAGGTVITILGSGFVTGMGVLLNGKDCPNVVVASAGVLTCLAPAFVNTAWINRPLDIVLVHPNGLKDIAKAAWRYTT